MAVVGLAPITMRNAVLTIASDDFTAAVAEATFAPEVQYEWLPVGFGTEYAPVFSGVRWVVMLSYAQDLTPGSLARYLLAQAAATRTLTLTPTAGGPTVTADVMVVPGQMGGRADDGILAANVTLPLFGEPAVS